jgi:hypothetical protein
MEWALLGIFLLASGLGARQMWRMFPTLADRLIVFAIIVGIVGFLSGLWLPLLSRIFPLSIALPNSSGAAWIQLADGSVVVVSEPTSRAQIYGPDGRFRHGFSVPTGGKGASLHRDDGRAFRICRAVSRTAVRIDPATGTASEAGPCEHYVHPSYPPPPIHHGLLAWLLFPLWHPFAAWILGASGMIAMLARHPDKFGYQRIWP